MPGTTSNSARVAWLCVAAFGVFLIWLAAPSSSNVGIGFFYAVPIGLATWWFGARPGVVALLACAVLYCTGALLEPIPHFGIAIGLDAAAAFVPSTHGVSGDFYLLTNGPEGSAVAIVGDIVSHGPAAARLATFVRARLAALAAGTSDPAELLMLANGALIDRAGGEKELASAVCLRLRGEELHWAVAGHPPPLRLPGLEELAPAGSTYLLGADPELELANRASTLAPGEGIFAYTDGATDVRREKAMLGVAGLRALLAPLAERPAQAIVSQTEKAILEWAGKPIQDDLCLLALKPR